MRKRKSRKEYGKVILNANVPQINQHDIFWQLGENKSSHIQVWHPKHMGVAALTACTVVVAVAASNYFGPSIFFFFLGGKLREGGGNS